MTVFWGDLHAHSGVSYDRGAPHGALSHAREHLDFCSLTGHGVTGILAKRLRRESLWEALRTRRTIASTGARIEADVHLGDAGIGECTTVVMANTLNLDIRAAGTMDKAEIIKVGQVTPQ